MNQRILPGWALQTQEIPLGHFPAPTWMLGGRIYPKKKILHFVVGAINNLGKKKPKQKHQQTNKKQKPTKPKINNNKKKLRDKAQLKSLQQRRLNFKAVKAKVAN